MKSKIRNCGRSQRIASHIEAKRKARKDAIEAEIQSTRNLIEFFKKNPKARYEECGYSLSSGFAVKLLERVLIEFEKINNK